MPIIKRLLLFTGRHERPKEWMEVLLQYNPNLNIKDEDNNTALDAFFKAYLLPYGMDCHPYVYCEWYKGCGQYVALTLLNASASFNTNVNSLFLRAASLGHFELMLALLEKGADLTCSDDDGKTALHLCWVNCRGKS